MSPEQKIPHFLSQCDRSNLRMQCQLPGKLREKACFFRNYENVFRAYDCIMNDHLRESHSSTLLPNSILSGPLHEIRAKVKNDGLENEFIID